MCYGSNFSYSKGTFVYSKDLYVFCSSLMNSIIANFKIKIPRRKLSSIFISVNISTSLTALIFSQLNHT